MSGENQVGKIGWIDITVDDADGLRDFYKEVVGWTILRHKRSQRRHSRLVSTVSEPI